MHGNNEVKHLYDAMQSEREINAKNMERKI